jgi:class 3 adenylate cyclase
MVTCVTCGAPLPDGARFCPSCGADQTPTTTAVAEERKLATVVFVDLVGSTALGEREDPERIRALQERFFAAMAEEIEQRGGTVEKFAGDAVMAVFGAPAALEDHAERALHAALAMQRRLGDDFAGEIQARIGVSTGEVVSGQPRDGGSFVTGDSVNVGARLEQAAAPGQVLAAERTVAAARGAFEFGEARVVEARGKPGGVACRPVLRALTLTRPRGVGGLHRAFVGRESELELLRATFRRTAALSEPHLVTVVGAPGVGKSRLVRELWALLDDEAVPPVRRSGRCLPYGDGITYWPLGEVLKDHFGILEDDSPEEILDRLADRRMLGLALGLDVSGDVHPLEARERLREGVVAFVEELARERAAVMLVEDVHWAEDDLLDLLERVLRDARAPVVVVATARPELLDRRATWGAGLRNATTIWLDPLPADATSRLLSELLSAELPPELRDLVVARAEGNPFFVEELLGALVDAGVLERRGETWVAGELPEGFSVPDSVHAVLSARVDRLPATEKAALQAASVVGRVFWRGPVVHLLDGEEPDLELLEERDFVRRHHGSAMAGEREYGIKHALTREVAYSTIPKARRGRMHAGFADWLESSERAKDEHASLLAYHYSEAVRPEDADLVWASDLEERDRVRRRAVHWLRRAAELAGRRHELEEAVDLYHRAIELCRDDHERALLWREVGRMQAYRYDGEAMRSALLRALEGPLDDDERADTYSFLAFQASIRSAMWSIRLNRDQIEEWVERALDLAGEGTAARARALLARVNAAGESIATKTLARAVAAVEALDDVELRSYALGARSQAAFAGGDFAEAWRLAEERHQLVPEIDDPDHLCEVYEAGTPVAGAVHRFDWARDFIARHTELAKRLSPHHRVHAVSLALELGELLADWALLVAETDRVADAVAQNLATPCVRNPRDLLLCAVAHACLGDDARARELENGAARIAPEGYDSYLAEPRLRLALERGERDAVETLARLPIERSYVWGPAVFATRLDALIALQDRTRAEVEAVRLATPGTVVEPFALRALGFARRDDELLARADARFAELGLGWYRSRSASLLAGL